MAIAGRLHPLLVHCPIALDRGRPAQSAAIVTHRNRGGGVFAFMTSVWGAEFPRA